MGRVARTMHIVGVSTRSVEEAVRDGMAAAARLGAAWVRITRITARAADDRCEQYRVGLIIGLSPA
jgi:flavin-binding protein dodecin